MIEMNPCYAHDSAIGPVFDVATWSRAKAWSMAIFAPVIGLVLAAALVLAWKPTLIMKKPPEVISSFHKETLKLQKEHPWIAYGVSGGMGLFSCLAMMWAYALLVDAAKGDYYFRAGPGGFSLRLPGGLDWSQCGLAIKPDERDIAMDEISDWKIVQRKQMGSMSRNAGNISADLKIRTVDGKRRQFSLNGFREPGHVIHSKINDAFQMVPASFAPEPSPAQPAEHRDSQPVTGIEAKCDVLLRALGDLMDRPGNTASVVLSDAEKGKFVQLAGGRQTLLLDLPRQALDENEFARAAEYFSRLRRHLQEAAGVESADGTIVIGQGGFQVNLTDAEQAAGLALQLFAEVYGLPEDFPLVVEQV